MGFLDLVELRESEFVDFFDQLSWKDKQIMILSIKRLQFLRRCQYKIQSGLASEYGLTLQEELYLKNEEFSIQTEGHLALNTYGLAAFRVLKYQEMYLRDTVMNL
jgi:hypothetical protein